MFFHKHRSFLLLLNLTFQLTSFLSVLRIVFFFYRMQKLSVVSFKVLLPDFLECPTKYFSLRLVKIY